MPRQRWNCKSQAGCSLPPCGIPADRHIVLTAGQVAHCRATVCKALIHLCSKTHVAPAIVEAIRQPRGHLRRYTVQLRLVADAQHGLHHPVAPLPHEPVEKPSRFVMQESGA